MAASSESSSPTDRTIELADVHLTLPTSAGPVHILRGVDLAVGSGDTVSVVGPSGAGKTSLLMIIAGLERPTRGRVEVAGRGFDGLDEDALARLRRDHIGVVFQSFHLIPTMTALENVAIPLELSGRDDAFERASETLRAVGLGERLAHYPDQLSGGEQQRVGMARAFVPEPDVLLADEPTGNLDGATGGLIMDLLFDLAAQRGTTLMLITHDPALAERCHRSIHIADGRIAHHA